MRVIAGTARSVPLVAPRGLDTRPTTDRIKETLFNIIQNDVGEALVLDIFAGSGAIGIEALSRGAKKAVFIDNSRQAADCITQNLKKTKLDGSAAVLQTDAVSAIARLEREGEVFDLVFMDPPYGGRLWAPVLSALRNSKIIDINTLIIIEESLSEDFPEELIQGYEKIREKCYKNQKHVFFRIRG